MKFRKKPVVIDAIQFVGGDPEAFSKKFPKGVYVEIDGIGQEPTGNLIIETLEGDHLCRPGDWVITGIKGELYPCKPDIFEATYEAIE